MSSPKNRALSWTSKSPLSGKSISDCGRSLAYQQSESTAPTPGTAGMRETPAQKGGPPNSWQLPQ